MGAIVQAVKELRRANDELRKFKEKDWEGAERSHMRFGLTEFRDVQGEAGEAEDGGEDEGGIQGGESQEGEGGGGDEGGDGQGGVTRQFKEGTQSYEVLQTEEFFERFVPLSSEE